MQIAIVLEVNEYDDIDENDGTGLANHAYENLVRALVGAGFSIVEGPYAGAVIEQV